ncbi:MAG: class I SAM-dependent RNA methyltransferase [bacterium]|nr:class I SAM-dependent RNA methyltransferase [bacterium]
MHGLTPLSCPVSTACGGCPLIDEPYSRQLGIKTRIVRDALARWPALASTPVRDCVAAPQTEAYRNRAKLALRADAGRVVAGLYRRGTDEVVDISQCRVQGHTSLAALREVVAWLQRHSLARPGGPLRNVDLRETAAGGVHLNLVAETGPNDALELPVDDLQIDGLSGVSVNFNPRASSYVFGPTTRTLRGERTFFAAAVGPDGERREFEVPAVGFFQVATGPLAAIHRELSAHLGRGGPLLDLYCGVGLHGLTLSAPEAGAAPLIGIEEVPASAACARRNAARMGVAARFRTGRVEALAAAEIEKLSGARVILNPGRPGCRDSVLRAITAGDVRRIAYLSCNPETLARDLAALAAAGREVVSVTPYDMMPQTAQVEALALLS